jgi:anti-sigma28 factor (negative regulator of flagellin synthesis)
MELSKINSPSDTQTQSVSLQNLENSKLKNKANAQSETVAVENDTQDLGSLATLKSFVAGAKQAGRADYITSLKEAVESGSYNPSTKSIVDAMFTDGTIEALL